MARIVITVYDLDGAPLTGIEDDITFAVFKRVNADDSIVDLSGSEPDFIDDGDGDYHAEVDNALVLVGSTLRYRIDCTVDASIRYLDGVIDQSAVSEQHSESSADDETMPVDLELKRNDLQPAFEATLRGLDGEPLDLSAIEDLELQFRMRILDGSVLKVDSVDVDVVEGKPGRIRYEWVAGDTDQAGLFDVEVVVVTDGPQTFPASHFFKVEIFSSLLD